MNLENVTMNGIWTIFKEIKSTKADTENMIGIKQ